MYALVPFLLLLPSALGSVVPPPLLRGRAGSVVSPNKTCGTTGAGANNAFTCPSTDSCCSQFGYCGSEESFCLTTNGCQATYSLNRTSCFAPTSGKTISVDGTCGTTGAGKAGYRCPTTGTTCCSSYGYCGNTTSHCDAAQGCQAGFGTCQPARPPRALPATLPAQFQNVPGKHMYIV